MSNTENPGEDMPDGGDQLTNEQRRAEAKRKLEQRLGAQEAAARKRRRIVIGTSLVVVVAIVATGGTLLVTKILDDREKAKYASCTYTPTPAAQNPFNSPPEVPPNLAPDQRVLAEQFRDQFVTGKSKQRTAPLPESRQLRKGELSATFTTSQGTLPVTLKRSGAPCNVAAIASLIRRGYYDDTPCQRLTAGGPGQASVLQCGDPTGTGYATPGWASPDEFPTDLKALPQDPQSAALGVPPQVVYPRGTVAIANSYQETPGGPPQGANTGSAQFFITVADSTLAPTFSVIGSVDQPGLAVLEKIAKGGVTPVPRPQRNPATGQLIFAPIPGDGTPTLRTTIQRVTID